MHKTGCAVRAIYVSCAGTAAHRHNNRIIIIIFAHRLTEPLVSLGEFYIPVPKTVYKGLVRHGPVLEYGSSVWDPQGAVLQEGIESGQKRAVGFETGNYNYITGSMTGILGLR